MELKPLYKIPKEIKRYMKVRQKFERYLYKLMDKGLLKDWYYNGEYHVQFKDVKDLVNG